MCFSDEVSRKYESSNKHVYNNQISGLREFLIRYTPLAADIASVYNPVHYCRMQLAGSRF